MDRRLLILAIVRNSRPEVFCKKGVLRNFTKFKGKHLCQSLFLSYSFIKKAILAQVFSSEFCEISKNTFYKEHLLWLLPKQATFCYVYVTFSA